MNVAVVPRRMGLMKGESISQEPLAVATQPAPAEWAIESEDFFMPFTTQPPCDRPGDPPLTVLQEYSPDCNPN